MNELEKKVRDLGAAIQATPEYIALKAAKLANDNDGPLQEKIGEFNLIKLELDRLLSEGREQNKDAISAKNAELRETYAALMETPSMQEYNRASGSLNELSSMVIGIIRMCINGEDPETADFAACGGSCDSCSGCN
jgi:Uncharacterized conserved protein